METLPYKPEDIERVQKEFSDETLDIIIGNLRDYAKFEHMFNSARFSATSGPITELDAKCVLCEMIAIDCEERNYEFLTQTLHDKTLNNLIAWSFLWRFHFYRDQQYLNDHVFAQQETESGEETCTTHLRPEQEVGH